MNKYFSNSSGPAFTARGFALVTVLAILALTAALVVGLLIRANMERVAASSFHSSVTTRQLADTAVSLVQGQINLASTQGSNIAWVSQPGMVRTFDTAGSLKRAYKLYSAPDMISGSAGIASGSSSDLPSSDWASSPALWTDLNEPMNGIYPILDPSAAPTGYTNTSGTSVVMPVKWLYVLQDGSVVAPTATGSNTVAVEGTSSIVGRIAFWTDDESCKVNINTAGEGTYWDMPRADTTTERAYASYQPARNEFQRYPGHPAMTCLSSVFPALSGSQIYAIVPRVEGGGSYGGTIAPTAAITLDNDRLYASVDELLYTPSRSVNTGLSQAQVEQAKFFITAQSRSPETNLFNLPRVACWPIHSDLASNAESPYTTAFDRLIAFCASTGTTGATVPYYFQRADSQSITGDVAITRNNQIYQYLHYLMSQSIPGSGGRFSDKYPSDADQILTEIFDYIRSVNLYDSMLATKTSASTTGSGYQYTSYRDPSSANPGLGSGLWWPGYGQVVPSHGPNSTMGFGRFATLSEIGTLFICNAAPDDPSTTGTDESLGSNDPSTNNTLGGTKLGVNQKRIQAATLLELFSVMQGWNGMVPSVTVQIVGLDQLSVTDGAGNTKPLGLPASQSAYFAKPLGSMSNGRDYGGNLCFRYTSAPGRSIPSKTTPDYPFVGSPITISTTGGTIVMNGAVVTVSLYAGDSTASSALVQKMEIKIPGGTFPIPNLVDNTYGATAKEFWWRMEAKGINGTTTPGGRLLYARNSPTSNGAVVQKNFDVLRTVIPSHGDYRLIAAAQQITLPSSVNRTDNSSGSPFEKHPGYDDTARRIAASFGAPYDPSAETPWDSGGKYISNITYTARCAPKIPSDASVTPESTGDYDTGMADSPDGPYVNKPDEGNLNGAGTSAIPYFTNDYTQVPTNDTYFSPNRQMPSPGMFGSLPTGVKSGTPWQTLLFRHQDGHPGAASPKDHLMMDLFWMPVVEPYAISDRFSTAGKINLNYQILPFTNLTRVTGIYALLNGEKVAAIGNDQSGYKTSGNTGEYRYSVNVTETLKQFTSKFSTGDVFKAASEICDLDIVPQGTSLSGMTAFWSAHQLTGDNLRERVYTTLYPRLTVRSNTYTVHFRVQTLCPPKTAATGTWTEKRDSVIGEYRGATVIERFISPDTAVPDYAKDAANSTLAGDKTLDSFYKWRVIRNTQFNP